MYRSITLSIIAIVFFTVAADAQTSNKRIKEKQKTEKTEKSKDEDQEDADDADNDTDAEKQEVIETTTKPQQPSVPAAKPVTEKKLPVVAPQSPGSAGDPLEIVEDPNPADSNGVYRSVSQMPQFQDGDVYNWLVKKIRYPAAALKIRATGKVIVEFVVDNHGKILSPVVRRSSGNDALDQEALRVIGLMPDWIPGRNKGVPVAVRNYLPITFNLD